LIYFLRCERDFYIYTATGSKLVRSGAIKIGTSTRLSVRLKQIAAEIGHMPTVLAVLDGAFAEEHALHVRFKSSREFCEWFYPDTDLLRLIELEGRPWDGEDEISPQKTTPVRLTDEAIKYARIASGFTSESMSEYVSRVVAERGKEDMDRFYAKEKGEKPSKGKKGEPNR
jgi:hypothetical protein